MHSRHEDDTHHQKLVVGSAEIITISLGTVTAAPFLQQATVLTGVAGIVKIDDAVLYLSLKNGERLLPTWRRKPGRVLLLAAPYQMKSLSVLSTAAMILVGGGILTHGIPSTYHLMHGAAHHASELPLIGGLLGGSLPSYAMHWLASRRFDCTGRRDADPARLAGSKKNAAEH